MKELKFEAMSYHSVIEIRETVMSRLNHLAECKLRHELEQFMRGMFRDNAKLECIEWDVDEDGYVNTIEVSAGDDGDVKYDVYMSVDERLNEYNDGDILGEFGIGSMRITRDEMRII